MSWWQKILALVFGETITIIDPYFGEMKDAGDYFEGEKLFSPVSRVVELTIPKSSDGQLIEQQRFHRWLIDNYDQVLTIVLSEFGKVREESGLPLPQKPDAETLELVHLELANKPITETPEWSLTYYANNELQHFFFLQMEGLTVDHYTVDG